MRRLGVIAASVLSVTQAFASPLSVKISFIEALAPRDTTSSQRFQKEFEATIQLGNTLLKSKLKACGYQLESKSDFYDASDPLQAKERGERAAGNGSWLIVGPRRSNHYLLLAQGAPETPTVSLMASSSEVSALSPMHLSLSPSNRELAKKAAQETARRVRQLPGGTYVSIVSKDCLTCGDFADHFRVAAKALRLKEVGSIDINGDAPELEPLRARVAELKPAFILLPNFSKVSAHVIAGFQGASRPIFFVGGDGWGDAQFGFLQNGKNLTSTAGLTVRGFPPVEEGLRHFPLGQRVLADPSLRGVASSGPGLAILRAMESTVELLCTAKPKSSSEFRAAFLKRGRKDFSTPWGVSVYQLKDGNLSYFSTKRSAR